MSDRAYYAEEPGDPDTNVTVAASADGSVSIGVQQEKAVDSYNQTFTCTIDLTKDQARALVVYLAAALLSVEEQTE